MAKNILRHGEGGLEAVADRVGYGSASAFSVAFARNVGIPPMEFARQSITKSRKVAQFERRVGGQTGANWHGWIAPTLLSSHYPFTMTAMLYPDFRMGRACCSFRSRMWRWSSCRSRCIRSASKVASIANGSTARNNSCATYQPTRPPLYIRPSQPPRRVGFCYGIPLHAPPREQPEHGRDRDRRHAPTVSRPPYL